MLDGQKILGHSNASSPLNEHCATHSSYGSFINSYQSMRSRPDSSLFSNLAQRLRFQKDLYFQRRAIAILGLIFGLVGLILAVVEVELIILYGISKNKSRFNFYSFIIKCVITLTTIALVLLILVYHHLDLRIQMERYNLSESQLAINLARFLKVLLEVIICSFHPPPGTNGPIYATKPHSFTMNSLDGIMSILMFLRIYLLARVLILCSSLHQDTLAQSFGAINRTSLNTNFIFKSWINLYAGYVLIMLIFLVVFWGGWSLRVCEMYGAPYFLTFSNSLWLTGVTFLTIGYGDIIPFTVCAKFVAVVVGALGAGCTALVVAIVATKLELTQSEKYLHNFVQESQLNHRLRRVSANIIKYAWKLHKYRKLKTEFGEKKKITSMYYQRQLVFSIKLIGHMRTEKRHLSDSSVSILEVNRAQVESHQLLECLNDKIFSIEKALLTIKDKLGKE